MNIQRTFARHLIVNRNLFACDEVQHYGHRCDVLAISRDKPLIFEYEFKSSSEDLKFAEFKKEKYRPYETVYGNEIAKSRHWKHNVMKDWKRPHFFYFVVPEWLWEKEQEFLKSLDVGTMIHREAKSSYSAHFDGMEFYVVKRTSEHKANPQNYHIAMKNITHRLSNVYAF